jgi:hypothetical protein
MLHHILTNQVWARAEALKVPKVNVLLCSAGSSAVLLSILGGLQVNPWQEFMHKHSIYSSFDSEL